MNHRTGGVGSVPAGWRKTSLATGIVLTLLAGPLGAQQGPRVQRVTLSGAVREAIERSPRVLAAGYLADEASGQVSEAWGSVLPSLDLAANYTRNVSPSVNFLPAVFFDPDAGPDEQVAVQFGADNQWQSFLTLEQPLFDGRAFVGVGAASRYLSLQEEVLRGETQSVVTGVRTAYYNALLADEQVRLTENSVSRVRQSLDETRKLNQAGLASEYDVLRLEVELANLEPNLLRAHNANAQAKRELAVQLSLDPGEELEVEGSLATMDLEDLAGNSEANRDILAFTGIGDATTAPPPEAAVEQALEGRSDLRQLELTEDLRQAELRAEQADYLPKVSLTGTYGVLASQNGSPEFFGRPRAYARQVGVQVTLPVFSGFSREARVGQKRSALRAARTQTEFARREAESEVRTLVDQVEESRQRAGAQHLAVGQAQRGFEIARAQFREGLSSQLELTDAEVALRQSEFNYAQAVYDYLVAKARLDEATGKIPLVDEGSGRR